MWWPTEFLIGICCCVAQEAKKVVLAGAKACVQALYQSPRSLNFVLKAGHWSSSAMALGLGMASTGCCAEHGSEQGAVRCLETPLRTDFRLPSQGCVLRASQVKVEMQAKQRSIWWWPCLPSPPHLRTLPGKDFWVRQAACIPAKGMRSRGISTDGHWDSERLWPAPGLQGSWNPVSSLCCYQQLRQWSFLQSPLAFIVPSQARCCATPVGNGMRKLIFFLLFSFWVLLGIKHRASGM